MPGVRVYWGGVGKICRPRFWPGVAGYHPSTVADFGRTVVYRRENIERQEEKESGCVEIKLKRHLVMRFSLMKGFRDDFKDIAIGV